MMDRSHYVEALPVHMKGKYRETLKRDLQGDLTKIGQKLSPLEAWFQLNRDLKERIERQEDLKAMEENGKKLSKRQKEIMNENIVFPKYKDTPETYRWDAKNGKWIKRQNRSKVIGRLYEVGASEIERFCLRYFLNIYFTSCII